MASDSCRIIDKKFAQPLIKDPLDDLIQTVFTFKQFMWLITKKPQGYGLGMGKPIHFDEPSYAMSKRDWYKEANKVLVLSMESMRFLVHPVFIAIISMNLLDKTIRSYLVQYSVELRDRGKADVYRLKSKKHEDGYYRYGLCELRYPMFDWTLCNRDSCLDCRKLEKKDSSNKYVCNLYRARYERKKAAWQEIRYSDALIEFTKKESQQLPDEAIDRMCLSIHDIIINDKGEPDAVRLQIGLKEKFDVIISRNRAYKTRKRLLMLYPERFITTR